MKQSTKVSLKQSKIEIKKSLISFTALFAIIFFSNLQVQSKLILPRNILTILQLGTVPRWACTSTGTVPNKSDFIPITT